MTDHKPQPDRLPADPREDAAEPGPPAAAGRGKDVARGRTISVGMAAQAAQAAVEAGPLRIAEPSRPDAPAEGWRTLEPAAVTPAGRSQARHLQAPIALGEWLHRCQPFTGSEPQPIAVDAAGRLVMRSTGAVHSRLNGLVVIAGAGYASQVRRRTRGRQLDESLGGDDDTIMHLPGPVMAVVTPPAGQRLWSIRLDDDLLYVREANVMAFDDRVGFESGTLPIGDGNLQLMQFHGAGTVVLRTRGEVMAWPVLDDQLVRTAGDRLIGWAGRLFPAQVDDGGPRIGQRPEHAIGFRGEGYLLLD
jgi:hypothetical protein